MGQFAVGFPRRYRHAILIYLITIIVPVGVLLWLGVQSFDRQRQALATRRIHSNRVPCARRLGALHRVLSNDRRASPAVHNAARRYCCVGVSEMDPRSGRRNLRLPTRDYAASGAYFVTLTSSNNADLFGAVVAGQVCLNQVGEIVAANWRWLASRYPHVTLDEWCLMPNHLHGIVVLTTAVAVAETSGADDAPGSPLKPLGRLIGAFKTRSTNQVNRARGTPGAILWHRNFWDRIIRDEFELARTREYIRRNPGAYRPRTFNLPPTV